MHGSPRGVAQEEILKSVLNIPQAGYALVNDDTAQSVFLQLAGFVLLRSGDLQKLLGTLADQTPHLILRIKRPQQAW